MGLDMKAALLQTCRSCHSLLRYGTGITPLTIQARSCASLNTILQEKHEGVSFDDEYLKMLNYPSQEDIFAAEDQLSRGDSASAKNLITARAKEMVAQISKAVCC